MNIESWDVYMYEWMYVTYGVPACMHTIHKTHTYMHRYTASYHSHVSAQASQQQSTLNTYVHTYIHTYTASYHSHVSAQASQRQSTLNTYIHTYIHSFRSLTRVGTGLSAAEHLKLSDELNRHGKQFIRDQAKKLVDPTRDAKEWVRSTYIHKYTMRMYEFM